MNRKLRVAVGAAAVAVAASLTLTGPAGSQPAPSGGVAPSGAAQGGVAQGGTGARPAAAPNLLEFDQAQATAANAPNSLAEPVRTCGAQDRRFLGELLQGSPLDFKIPYRLGDVTTSDTKPSSIDGKQAYISGTASSSVVGSGDFPFDHPFGSDFNMDVAGDTPFANLTQDDGVVVAKDQHVELGAGQFPHTPQPDGVDGDEWETNSVRSRTNLQPGFVPSPGDRVVVAGRWVNDCGHNNPFQTELHPISFMGWAHEDAPNTKTVSQVFYAPYRETQLYSATRALSNKVNDPSRLTAPGTMSFPMGLIQSMLAIQQPTGPDRLESWGLEEANTNAPVDWKVCAPASATGQYVGLRYDFVARPGVDLTYTADHTAGCVTLHASFANHTQAEPPLHTCVAPWAFLDQVAGAEAGVPNLDLKAELAKFVSPQYQSRLDPDPELDCYNPLAGPTVSANPIDQKITTDPAVLHPFYGRVEVFRTDVAPPTSTTASSSTSSSSTSSSSSSSSSTPAGQKITVTPATVAQGGTIQIDSSGWAPGATVTVTVGGVSLGTLTADPNGNVKGSFTVPSSVLAGQQNVTLTGTGNDGKPLTLSTPITVTAATATPIATTTSGSLPVTGARIAWFVAGGAVLVLLGLGIVAGTRRRTPAASDPTAGSG